jgi:O-antigen ligase
MAAACVGLLVLAMLLGGGQGGLGDTFVQLLALALAGWLALRAFGPRPSTRIPAPGALVAAILALPLLHLFVRPLGAERALWSVVPACVLYLATLTLSPRRQAWLLAAIVAMALAGLLLGLAQLAGGPDSPLYLYANTNRGLSVGLFANRNHQAALLLMTLPLAFGGVAAAAARPEGQGPARALGIAGASVVAVVLLLGVAITQSRSGLLLGMVALEACAAMLMSLRKRRGVRRAFGLIMAAATLLTIQFALYGILQRAQEDALGDQRWQIAGVTAQAAKASAPLGTGLGTFRQVFQTIEMDAPGPQITNHAHDDYLELWLEGGWPFFALAGIVLSVLAWAAWGAWRSRDASGSLWPRAASISLMIVLLHSFFDYPLRTTAIEAVFAVLAAVLVGWRWRALERPRRHRADAAAPAPPSGDHPFDAVPAGSLR